MSIINRVEIRISLEGTDQAIPYSGEEREDGTINYGYYSILKDATAIDRIPELQDEPTMKEFVQRIHNPNGVFETVRTLHYYDWNEDKALCRKVFALGFVFRDRGLFNQYRSCIAFAGNLLETKHRDSRIHDVAFLLEIQPAIFRQEQARGWIMDLYFSGNGQTEQQASENLNALFPLLMPLLTNGHGNH